MVHRCIARESVLESLKDELEDHYRVVYWKAKGDCRVSLDVISMGCSSIRVARDEEEALKPLMKISSSTLFVENTSVCPQQPNPAFYTSLTINQAQYVIALL